MIKQINNTKRNQNRGWTYEIGLKVNVLMFNKIIKKNYLGESKVLQYFINVRHNLAVPDSFAKAVKVINNTEP